MTTEPSVPTFVATVRRSRLIEATELDRLATRHQLATARSFADALIASGDLTHYQADKLLRGRWQGLVLGPYSVLAPLGRGGMGTVVYLARDRRLTESLGDSVLVALKLLPQRKAAHDPNHLARFRREMELGRRVGSEQVVRTSAAGEIDEVHYLALEYIPGRTLRQIVLESGPIGIGDAARIFADVATGLAHIHERGLVHRDVKPGNIMVRPDGGAVVLDLGLAYAPGEPLPDDPRIVGGRGYVVGTMDFLAPEQARDASSVGPAADLYSLGCTIFYAITASVPFPASTTKEKIRRHRNDALPALSNVPAVFAEIVHRLMAKQPYARYESANQVRDVLKKWATAAKVRSAVDAVALADTPGADVVLWDAVPGEDLPILELAEAPVDVPRDDSDRAGLLLAALLFGLMLIMALVWLLRRFV